MGKVVKAIIVTKPEDLPKVELGQTSIILRPNLNIKDIDKGKISEIQKSAEEELGNSEISDQEKYLLDQKIEVLKSIN